jgi:hypothetical protein
VGFSSFEGQLNSNPKSQLKTINKNLENIAEKYYYVISLFKKLKVAQIVELRGGTK